MISKSKPQDKPVWQPLEHQLRQQILALPESVLGMKFLLMVSGGADSLALLMSFRRLQASFEIPLEISVMHVHHGEVGVSPAVRDFRNQSERMVRELAEKLQVKLEVIRNRDGGLLSEEQARDFRQAAVRTHLGKDSETVFVWGHHREDLLETRFLRLIRGTGVQGLRAMQVFRDRQFRPWLETSRQQIENYLKDLGQAWLLDPDQDNLRSWLRLQYFPQLESRQSGALGSLARSLEQLAQLEFDVEASFPDLFVQNGSALSLQVFMCMNLAQKKQALAQYLFSLSLRDYTQGHIQEILKRLDKLQVVHSFELLGLVWHINAEQIQAVPKSK